MEKKGNLRNCKIFDAEGRFFNVLPAENELSIKIIGKNESEEIIYREGVYFLKEKIFQTSFSDGKDFFAEEYEIASIEKPIHPQFENIKEFNLFSAMGDQIEELFLYWPRLVFYKDTHPEESEGIIQIKGQLLEPCRSIFTIHIKLEDITEEGFYYCNSGDFYKIASRYDGLFNNK